MTAATHAGPRIAILDIVRGIAVMGILAMNIVAFAMPFQAYMNPLAYGWEGSGDYWSWVVSFIFVDGKMRGLFSFLFGASTLLVIDRAEAGEQSAASVHYPRMLWLLLFGLLHFYFIWFGDILASYALIGLLLYFFRRLGTRALVIWGLALIAVQFLLFLSLAVGATFLAQAAAMPNPDPDAVRQWQSMGEQFGILTGQPLAEKLGLFQGPYSGLVEMRLTEQLLQPFAGVFLFGSETLAYMLFGMAALKTGFFKGEWSLERYRRVALISLGIAIPAYAALAWMLTRDGFTVPMILGIVMAATTPFRPLMVIGYAALIILLTHRGGVLVDRIAAAGRAAFTNYLGTSILMTALFYGWGLGLYGTLSRIELWIPVMGMWALMLIWSKPWLDRYRYGPFEWLWRSLARWRPQPMRRPIAAAAE
jgi:uncharacterized protein